MIRKGKDTVTVRDAGAAGMLSNTSVIQELRAKASYAPLTFSLWLSRPEVSSVTFALTRTVSPAGAVIAAV